MRRSTPLILLCLGALLIVPLPASAVPIHRHIVKTITAGGDPFTAQLVKVVNVAPPDSDKDGLANRKDPCPHAAGPGGCPAPVPAVSSPAIVAAPTPAPVSVAPAPVGGCPASMAAESGSAGYGAYNASSGATGCYQILPSTAAAHGCDLSTPGGQDQCAQSICATEGPGAWSSSGANPC